MSPPPLTGGREWLGLFMQGITLIVSAKRKTRIRYHKSGGLSIMEVFPWKLERVRHIEPRPTGSIAYGTAYQWLAAARSDTAGPNGNRFVPMDCCPIWRSRSRATFASVLRVLLLPQYLKVIAPVLEFRLTLNRRRFEAQLPAIDHDRSSLGYGDPGAPVHPCVVWV